MTQSYNRSCMSNYSATAVFGYEQGFLPSKKSRFALKDRSRFYVLFFEGMIKLKAEFEAL